MRQSGLLRCKLSLRNAPSGRDWFSSGAVITCFYVLGLSRPGFEHSTFHMRGESSKRQLHRRSWMRMKESKLPGRPTASEQCKHLLFLVSDISSLNWILDVVKSVECKQIVTLSVTKYLGAIINTIYFAPPKIVLW